MKLLNSHGRSGSVEKRVAGARSQSWQDKNVSLKFYESRNVVQRSRRAGARNKIFIRPLPKLFEIGLPEMSAPLFVEFFLRRPTRKDFLKTFVARHALGLLGGWAGREVRSSGTAEAETKNNIRRVRGKQGLSIRMIPI